VKRYQDCSLVLVSFQESSAEICITLADKSIQNTMMSKYVSMAVINKNEVSTRIQYEMYVIIHPSFVAPLLMRVKDALRKVFFAIFHTLLALKLIYLKYKCVTGRYKPSVVHIYLYFV
jgi:thiosulfate reductase cytochrome b subunit